MAKNFVEGLSFHSQDQLALRFGLTSQEDLTGFARLVLGEEGVDWLPADIGPQRGKENPCHGRRVLWEDKGVTCVVAYGHHGVPIVVTVLTDEQAVETEESQVQSPRELHAQVNALLDHNTQLQEQLLQLHQENEKFTELKNALAVLSSYLGIERETP